MNKIGVAAVEEHTGKIREQYDVLEAFLQKSQYIAGENVSLLN